MRWTNSFIATSFLSLSLLGLVFLGSGCDIFDRQRVSEEMEAHYIEGMNARRLMDWEGAIVSFQNALQANPNSGAAHRELGLLYDEKRTNYLRALYHYDRFKEMRLSETNPVVEGRIFHCRVMLARDFATLLDRAQVQQEVNKWKDAFAQQAKLVDELKKQVGELSRRTNAVNTVVPPLAPSRPTGRVSEMSVIRDPQVPVDSENRAKPSATNRVNTSVQKPAATEYSPANPSSVPKNRPTSPLPTTFSERSPGTVGTTPVQPKAAASKKTYQIRSGDTLGKIAKQHGITVEKLQAANPPLNSRALKLGTSVVIPEH